MRGGAADTLVAVGVGGGDGGELVARELGALLVVVEGLLGGGGGRVRGEREQCGGGGGAVELSVGGGGAVVGAFGAAVVGVQVDHEWMWSARSGSAKVAAWR